MENNAINFRKERTFGDIYGSAFEFIRQEFKKLGNVIVFYVMPFLLITSLIMVVVQSQYINTIRNFTQSPSVGGNSEFGDLFLYYLLLFLCFLLAHTMLITATFGYITLYVKKGKDGFEVGEVWSKMKAYILPVLGVNIIIGIIVGIGFMLCIIPGIYLGISLSLIMIALIYEGKGFGDAFSRSFTLTKQDWWTTFLIIFIAFLLVTVLGYIIQLPAMIVGIGSIWTTVRENMANSGGNTDPAGVFSTTYIVVTSILSILTYILYVIPYVIISFQYFNLVERLEKPSLQERIEQIGENE